MSTERLVFKMYFRIGLLRITTVAILRFALRASCGKNVFLKIINSIVNLKCVFLHFCLHRLIK